MQTDAFPGASYGFGSTGFFRVVDARGRALFPGAEVRVSAAGRPGLLGLRLVDSGSGYDSQSDMPVHLGFSGTGPVDIEVTPRRAGAAVTLVRSVNPAQYVGRALTITVKIVSKHPHD